MKLEHNAGIDGENWIPRGKSTETEAPNAAACHEDPFDFNVPELNNIKTTPTLVRKYKTFSSASDIVRFIYRIIAARFGWTQNAWLQGRRNHGGMLIAGGKEGAACSSGREERKG